MKKFSVALGCTILMLGLVGCGDNETTNNKVNNAVNTETNLNTPIDESLKHEDESSSNDLKSNISHHISMVNGVNDSVVVVNDKDIIVGLDTNQSAEKAAIEKEVREMLEEDNAGYNVHVTSDHDIYQRINEIGDKLYPVTGEPVVDVTNDIKTLINDIGNSINNAIK